MADADSGQISRQEIEAVVETRHELGPSYEAEIVDSFAERIEQAIETRAGTQLARAQTDRSEAGQRQKQQFVLGIVSLGTGIPITAIAAAITDLPGLAVAWLGIVGVNVAHALQGRKQR